jgi:hypothetical protein
LARFGEPHYARGSPEVTAFRGAERMLRFQPQVGAWLEKCVPLEWSAPEAARQLAATGPA